MQQNHQQDTLCYHHFALTFSPEQVSQRFADVRFVLIAGCHRRVKKQAAYLSEKLDDNPKFLGPERPQLERLTDPGSRFLLLKLGPILMSNHGMGAASMSIAVHELMLMCREAGVLNKIHMIRFGTCGGLGVEPGVICVTNRALDPMFQDFVELKICAKLVRRPCIMDQETVDCLRQLAERACQLDGDQEPLPVRVGATVAANDFYEEQGRTNGAICEHSEQDKRAFLERAAKQEGVINMEMESNLLAAMCHKLNVKFGVICVALANRLEQDRVHLTGEQSSIFERRLFRLNSLFIGHHLQIQTG